VPTFRIRRLGALLAAALCLVAPSRVHAQGTATLPPSDFAYADIDRLGELGFLDSVVIAQRPYSRREIGRILAAARERSNQLAEGAQRHITDAELELGDGVLRRLEARFSRELQDVHDDYPVLAPLDAALISVAYTDAERRPFVGTFGSTLEATTGSLLPRRLGIPLVPGTTGALELSQRLEPTPWLAFAARERADYAWAKDSALRRGNGEILLASMRLRVRNLALEIGRSQLSWAQSPDEGLFLAADAPALDQVSLSSDRPFVMPGVLRLLGPTKATLVVAELGPSTVRSYSKLLAYKVSIQPSHNAELGATFFNHYGGEGGRPSSLGNRLIDFLPFVDIFRRHNYTDTTRTLDVDSDKQLGIDGRLRIGGLRGVLVTGEILIDDFDVNRIPDLFTGYGSQALGITFPRFISSALTLKLMAKHMGILTYTHTELSNGMTTRGRLLGDELGPDAKSFGARLTWQPAAALQLGIEGRSAIHSNAQYSTFYEDPEQTRFVVRKVSRMPNELRDRIGATVLVQTDFGPAVTGRFVTERSRNYLFQGYRHTDSAGELGFHLPF
jgi:hypothetical protein